MTKFNYARRATPEPWQIASKWDAPKKKKKIKSLKKNNNIGSSKHMKHQAQVLDGKGPHAGQLFCLECQKHIMWLTKQEMKIYKELTNG